MASIFFTIYKETPLEQNYSRGVLWYQISTFNVSVDDSAYAEIRRARREGLFDCDSANELRKSHENPEIKELYDTWLGKPLGEKAHSLLHTHYHQQIR